MVAILEVLEPESSIDIFDFMVTDYHLRGLPRAPNSFSLP
jgi:hypothetical protein